MPTRSVKNRLKDAHSPYLLQHAENPVEWHPWGDEAFLRAKKENKPIFLSIGYSSCHWCHVMAHESFEDNEIAAILNRSFVSIKVDREERPDIDAVYMAFAQALAGTGGWPLTVIMTPDKEPFFAATYIPKNNKFGRRGLTDILNEVETLWDNNDAGVRDSAGKLREAMEKQAEFIHGGTFTGDAVDEAFRELASTFDEKFGGFGNMPKFPSPHVIIFLLKYWKFTGNIDARRIAEKTLDAMISGGICDHIGGGFHRYSVTRDWKIPHFEKMLYDQAMMLYCYTEGWNASGTDRYKQVAEDTAEYLITKMQAENGGFFSAEDADSDNTEGGFYLWTSEELREAAGEYAEEVISAFDIGKDILSEEISGRLTGKQNLRFRTDKTAEKWYASENRKVIRRKLQIIRNTRPPPFRDEKILTDWNGLCIGALAYAGASLDHPEYIHAAEKAAEKIPYKDAAQREELLHSRYKEFSSGDATLDDYAFLLWGYLSLYAATYDAKWLIRAQNLTTILSENFRTPQGGYYLTGENAEPLLIRHKTAYDGALPSGNSMMAVSLVIISRLTADNSYEEDAIRILGTFAADIRRAPSEFCHLLSAYPHIESGEECVIVPGKDGISSLLHVLSRGYRPFRTITMADGSEEITQSAPFTRAMKQKKGKTTLYICREGTCSAPFTEFDDIEDYPLSDPFSPCTSVPKH